MADHQALNHDDHFEVVEALYQEATQTLSDDERAALEVAQAPAPKRQIIQSRKPIISAKAVPIFTRISDLYEEAEAERMLAHEEPETPEIPEAEMAQETVQASQLEDDFSIPATFDTTPALDMTPEEDTLPEEDTPLEEDILPEVTAPTTEITETPSDISDIDIALLDDALLQDETPPSDDVTISTQIEPAIALDDVLDGLLPPEDISENASSQAEALAQLDASRPQADDELTQQLADVKSAVEQAQITPQMPEAEDDIPTEYPNDENPDTDHNGAQDALTPVSSGASVATGPALATFIGETVREVLDEELPHLVRGLVDEALGERQGRYGRSQTPHIGLRTKPSRH